MSKECANERMAASRGRRGSQSGSKTVSAHHVAFESGGSLGSTEKPPTRGLPVLFYVKTMLLVLKLQEVRGTTPRLSWPRQLSGKRPLSKCLLEGSMARSPVRRENKQEQRT